MVDVKRLETEAAYWDELGAPSDATHALENDGTVYWEMWKDGEVYTHNCGGWDRYIHQSQTLFPRIKRPLPEVPESGSKWLHTSGRKYVVEEIANGRTECPEEYPVTVIYRDIDSGAVWCRPLSDWSRSFKQLYTKRELENLSEVIAKALVTKIGLALEEEDYTTLAEAVLTSDYKEK